MFFGSSGCLSLMAVPSGDPGAPSPPEVVSDALDPEVPVYSTSERLKAHRNKGHQPYVSGCDICQSARGRVPTCRKHMKHHYGPGELQVDFGFFGKNVSSFGSCLDGIHPWS